MIPLDPIALTRRLVDIESVTYNEAAVGAYLDNFLRERGFATERTAVTQPPNSRYTGRTLQCVRRQRKAAGCGAVHAHGYRALLFPQQ